MAGSPFLSLPSSRTPTVSPTSSIPILSHRPDYQHLGKDFFTASVIEQGKLHSIRIWARIISQYQQLGKDYFTVSAVGQGLFHTKNEMRASEGIERMNQAQNEKRSLPSHLGLPSHRGQRFNVKSICCKTQLDIDVSLHYITWC